MSSNLPAGQRLHNNHPIPTNAVIYTRNNREMYISSLVDTHLFKGSSVTIKYLDTGEFEAIEWGEASRYQPFCKPNEQPLKNKK